jgi:hypothetical protein
LDSRKDGYQGQTSTTTMHLGQNSFRGNSNNPAKLTTPATGHVGTWIFDANKPGALPGVAPLTIVSQFADMRHALTASQDGSTVYIAARDCELDSLVNANHAIKYRRMNSKLDTIESTGAG